MVKSLNYENKINYKQEKKNKKEKSKIVSAQEEKNQKINNIIKFPTNISQKSINQKNSNIIQSDKYQNSGPKQYDYILELSNIASTPEFSQELMYTIYSELQNNNINIKLTPEQIVKILKKLNKKNKSKSSGFYYRVIKSILWGILTASSVFISAYTLTTSILAPAVSTLIAIFCAFKMIKNLKTQTKFCSKCGSENIQLLLVKNISNIPLQLTTDSHFKQVHMVTTTYTYKCNKCKKNFDINRLFLICKYKDNRVKSFEI